MKNFLRVLLSAFVITSACPVFAFTLLNGNCGVEQQPPQTPAFQRTPCNTKYALGPFAAQTIWGVALPLVVPEEPSSWPSVLPSGSYAAIHGGFNAWNDTRVNTKGRLTGWSTVLTTSDCPVGQPFQVGMMNFFMAGQGLSCSTVVANGLSTVPEIVRDIPLAFSDYDTEPCTGCGTKSLTVNLAIAWSTDGATLIGHRDLQSVMAHEFGHVLGMGHNKSSWECGNADSPMCLVSPNRSTMENYFDPRTAPDTNPDPNKFETCGRSLGDFDILRANQLYPPLVGGVCQ